MNLPLISGSDHGQSAARDLAQEIDESPKAGASGSSLKELFSDYALSDINITSIESSLHNASRSQFGRVGKEIDIHKGGEQNDFHKGLPSASSSPLPMVQLDPEILP